MYKILISPPTYGRNEPEAEILLGKHCEILKNLYGRKLTELELIELAEDCDAIIAGTEMITGETLNKLSRLKVISRYGAGIDNVDIKAADQLGVKVYRTPDAPARAVAELAVCLIIDAARHTSVMHAEMKNNVWNKYTGFLLEGKNVGIIGLGRIGQKVAELLSPFEVNIRYYDIERKESPYIFEPSLNALLTWAHIITLHCNPPEDGSPLFGQDQLAMLKNDAVLVNTARGSLIDEDALCEALLAKPDMTAALDVYRDEPYNGRLREFPNVIMTPHIASAARETRELMDMEAALNCLDGLGIGLDDC